MCSGLDSTVAVAGSDGVRVPTCLGTFQFIHSEDVAGSLVCPCLKKPVFDPGNNNNYEPSVKGIIISVLSKVTERVVMEQFQIFLDEANCLDLFQFGFRHGYETEAAFFFGLGG